MPVYTFKNTETGEEFDKIMSYSAKLEYLEENPEIKSIISSAPKLAASVNQDSSHTARAMQAHGGWKDLMDGIKKKNPSLPTD